MEVKNPPSLFYTTGATNLTACWFVAQSAQYDSINWSEPLKLDT
jgi:hypothetical protein